MKRFTYIDITHFDGCEDCPLKKPYDNSRYCGDRCSYNDEDITSYNRVQGDVDHRNQEGVLDTCPFLKEGSITAED